MNALRMGCAVLAIGMLAGVGRAEPDLEDDDDPKSAQRRPAAAAPAAPAKKEPPKPAVKPEEPVRKAEEPVRKAEPAPAKKEEPVKKVEPIVKKEEPKKPASVEVAAAPAKKGATPPAPTVAPTPAAPGPVEPAAAAAARTVRVRLLDGSTVVGMVRAEQADALVVDCALGQLSIPRARISTIAYDTAAAVGQKRAPVQQLDDDLPKKR